MRNKCILLIGIVFILLIPLIHATDINVFYGEGCPHCKTAINQISLIVENDSELTLQTFEIYFNDTNRDFYLSLLNKVNQDPKGVPTFFIGNTTFIGFNENIKNQIINTAKECKEPCDTFALLSDNSTEQNMQTAPISLIAVIIGALVDAINPCAFAVLIILLTTLLNKKKSKKIIKVGLNFTAAIFISYLLMGLGLYKALSLIDAHIFFLVIGILAIILGIANLKDFFFYAKGFVVEVPRSWRPKLKEIISKVTSPTGAFLTGIIVSLFLLPCTSGPYIAVLGLLSKEASLTAFFYLVLYNMIFILPMIAITIGVAKGIDIAKLEEKRQKNLKNLHLIEGIALLLLGIAIIIFM